ncbi:M23 family metallopeptidase [candidate division KSB1 bacterium]|nr:M23 family metallopeptidase [candidate division KSB1 bacterium]
MVHFRNIILVNFVAFFCIQSVYSQDYIWPTNASQYLSASFAEYRAGHFHAGIDIKTQGRTGFPVFATRAGYIWQVRVSPYGYGRVIYQKLDTGEYAIYAHLERFSETLDNFITNEQMKRQSFSLLREFQPDDFPVAAGEIIAYTGESGIGPPHLHFELRDKANQPFNPLLKGYEVIDTQKPVPQQLAIIPLEPGTEINGQYEPVILIPGHSKNGDYLIEQAIQFNGKIGLAIEGYDPINFVANKLGFYSIKLFVDEKSVFSAKFDKFSYNQTNQIYLDRNFRLLRRGVGSFNNCYIDSGNQLSFYNPSKTGTGTIYSEPLLTINHESAISDTVIQLPDSQNLSNQFHQFRIELADFHQNISTISGTFIPQQQPVLIPDIEIIDQSKVILTNLNELIQDGCQNLDILISRNSGRSWLPTVRWPNKKSNIIRNHTNVMNDTLIIGQLIGQSSGAQILKINGKHQNGLPYRPYYKILKSNRKVTYQSAFFTCHTDFYDNYMLFDIAVSLPVIEPPSLTIQVATGEINDIPLIQTELTNYKASYVLPDQIRSQLKIELWGITVDGRGMFCEKFFDLTSINPKTGGQVRSADGGFQVNFMPQGLYRSIYTQIYEETPGNSNNLQYFSPVYRVEPFDIPLKKNARISIKYPSHYDRPEKLGIYSNSNGNGNWHFSGNNLDQINQTVSTYVSEFNTYVLIEDILPPEIQFIIPREGQQLSNRPIEFQCKILDNLSGIPDNPMAIRMYLDGKWILSELEPERKLVIHKPDAPLSKGKHTLKVVVKDRCQNVQEKSCSFWIL